MMQSKLAWTSLATITTVVAGALLLGLEPALAKSAGDLGAHVASQGENLGKAVSALSYVGGMGAGAATAYKFKANRENPHQHPIGHALGWAVEIGRASCRERVYSNV